MMRPLSSAGMMAGIVAATTLACSDSSDPSAAASPLPSPDAAAAVSAPTVRLQSSGTTERLQAISPVNNRVAWASGTGGTFTRTTDGGATWHAGVVPGARALEFRDVQGVSANVAYLMSAGPGNQSRIYKTVDGGATWSLQFKNTIPAAFYDCIAFWDRDRGIAYSDPVDDGIFPLLRTTNGKTWTNIGGRLPKARSGEFGFAASGTCAATQGSQNAWIVTGGSIARVVATTDGGDSWHAYRLPIVQGLPSPDAAAGATTIAFRDAHHGIVAGGDIGETQPRTKNVAVSDDGGVTWSLATSTPFLGSVYGLAYAPGASARTVVATGPGGAAYSANEGKTWHLLPGVANCWAVAFADRVGWLVGTNGQILKVTF